MLSKPLRSEAPLPPTTSAYHQDSDSDPADESYAMQFIPANTVANRFLTLLCCRRTRPVASETIPLLTEVTLTSTTADEADTFPFVLGDFENFATDPETLIAYEIEELKQQITMTLSTITKESFFLEKMWSHIKTRLKEYKAHTLRMKLCLIEALAQEIKEISINPDAHLPVLYHSASQTHLTAVSSRILKGTHLEIVEDLLKPTFCEECLLDSKELTIDIESGHDSSFTISGADLSHINKKIKQQLREAALKNVQSGNMSLIHKLKDQLMRNMQTYSYTVKNQQGRTGAKLASDKELSNIDIRKFISRLKLLTLTNPTTVDVILCHLLEDTTLFINEALTTILPHFLGVNVNILPENQHTTFVIMEASSHSNAESTSSDHSTIRIEMSVFHPDKDIIITTFPQPLHMGQIIPSPDSVSLYCELAVTINPHKPHRPTFSNLKVQMAPKQRRSHSLGPSFGLKH